MGSEFRRTYTVLGDAVNVASRVESLCRFYDVHIIVGEGSVHEQEEFTFRLLDRVRVVGRNIPLEIFELVSRKGELSDEKASEVEDHESALMAYFARDFDRARNDFLKLAKQYPGAKLYKLFLERIEELSRADLPQDWDGAYQWLSK
jgi:adenylate cyclase